MNIHIFVWCCIKGKGLLEFYGPQMLAVKSPKKITHQIPIDHKKLICFRFIEYRRTISLISKVSQSWKLEEVHRILLLFFVCFLSFFLLISHECVVHDQWRCGYLSGYALWPRMKGSQHQTPVPMRGGDS